jgi:hypothetical protein
MKKILFVLPFLPACIDVYLNPVKDDDTGETGIVVINPNAPKIESLTLSPDPVFTDQTLTATATVLDPDNEGSTTTYEWAWFVNDVDVEQNMETLSGLDSFNKGDTVEVQVTPTNEEGTGEMVAASA